MSTINGKWRKIFRAGDYGKKGKYTQADIAALAATVTNPGDAIPICIGHPGDNAPAFGWISQLKAEGDTLYGMPTDVIPAVDAAVQANAYPNVSVAFYKHRDGSRRLRHLGLLGAMPPEIQGLRDAQFGSEEFEEFSFNEGEEMDEAQVKRTVTETMSEFFSGLFGSKKDPGTATTITQADVDAAVARATDAVKAEFSTQLKGERDARQALQVKFDSGVAGTRAERLIVGLKARKHWLPAYDSMGVPELFSQLTSAGEVTIEFSQGDKVVKKDAAQILSDFIDGMGTIVPEGVLFSADKGLQAPAASAAPKVVEGVDVDAASVTFNAQVEAYATEHKVSFNEAFTALARQGKRPQVGAASAGAA